MLEGYLGNLKGMEFLRVCLPETNISPENRPLEEEIPNLETIIFRGENVSFREVQLLKVSNGNWQQILVGWHDRMMKITGQYTVIHPYKFNIEPENTSLQKKKLPFWKSFLFENHHSRIFLRFHVNFREMSPVTIVLKGVLCLNTELPRRPTNFISAFLLWTEAPVCGSASHDHHELSETYSKFAPENGPFNPKGSRIVFRSHHFQGRKC